MSLTKSTARRMSLLAGACALALAGPAVAADTTTNVNSNTNSLVVPTPGAGDTATVNVNSRIGSSSTTESLTGNLVITSGVGAGEVVINNNNLIRGRIDLSGISGGVSLNMASGAVWRTTGQNVLGSGDDTVVLADGGILNAGLELGATADQEVVEVPDVIDFGDGQDAFDNAGVIIVGSRRASGGVPQAGLMNPTRLEAELRLEGLEEFEHSGLILLGGFGNDAVDMGTDGWADDILSMPGTRYIGAGGEIAFDVDFIGIQNGCDASLRAANGDLAADCVAIIGGSTEGTTYLTVNDVYSGDRGMYNPDGIVLVDVSGGTSAAEHFVLSPDSDHYSTANGGVIDKGAFIYALVYDEDDTQHELVSLVGGDARQFPLLAQAAHSLWRLSTGTWLDRQADLRGDLPEGVGGGLWLRASSEFADRDVTHTASTGGRDFTFDNTHEQNSYAVTGGFDLLSGAGPDSGYVGGVMVGYNHGEVDYEASPNTTRFDGASLGVYASYIAGGLFIDGAVNANRLRMKTEMPALNLFPAGTILKSNLLSVGAQVEAGWRMPLQAGAFVEPLASLVYVRTEYDDLEIPADDSSRSGIGVEFDDPTSLRAGLGARLGLDQDYGTVRAQYSLLGRVWNEFEDETRVTLHNPGPDALVVDEFTGAFTELGLGASVNGMGGAVSGFLNVGGRWGDDYQATTASAGVRVNW